MKKGLELTVTGKSSRGTITNDIYTLKVLQRLIISLSKIANEKIVLAYSGGLDTSVILEMASKQV